VTCDRCYQPLAEGAHGQYLCPFEPRRDSRFPNVIADDIPGGMTIEHMSATPETFYSKSEHRRRVKELGLRIRDEHCSAPGTDKNRNVTKWT
jgi:hypothetical protein